MAHNINLIQRLTGEYAILVYKDSKKIADIFAGYTQEEAKQNAQDIAHAFKTAEVKDTTD